MRYSKIVFILPLLAMIPFMVVMGQNNPSLPAPDYSGMFGVAPSYDYTYFEEMVEGGDGFKLLTRIYLPKGDGLWPVVVTRTPYIFGGRGDNNAMGREYAKRGIGYIQQDCRGKGGSEGFYSPNIYERTDGIALYKWLDAQVWCGAIGIFGSSYTALTGWIVADSLPDKVKGLYLSHYGVDRHISCYRAGLFRQDIMSGWAIDNAAEDIRKPVRTEGQPVGENYYPFYRYFPQVEADVEILGQKLPYYRDWITHTDYNDPYWNSGVWGDLKSIPAKVNVPVTIVAGQFDHHEEGTLLGYERLNPEVKAKSRLILGAWNHSFQVTPTHVPTTNARDFTITIDQFKWLYSILIDGIIPESEIKVYAIEEDRWVNLDSWPLKLQEERRYFLSSEKQTDKAKAYILAPNTPREEKLSYSYNPLNPVMAVGGETIFTSIARRGSQLQPEAGYRDDVVSFVSDPLTTDMTIAGKIVLKLKISTDVFDTCFAFTLSEVCTDGQAYNMRTAITTLGYRNEPLANRQSYTPGEMVEITIEATPILWTVRAGNALRVDVKSSNFPEYAIHTNYAGIWAEQSKTCIAHQNIFVGGNNASFLIIPVIKI